MRKYIIHILSKIYVIYEYKNVTLVERAIKNLCNPMFWLLRWPNTVFTRAFADVIQLVHEDFKTTNMPSIERSFYLLNTRTICAIFLYN